MSAFIVDRAHIAYLVWAGLSLPTPHLHLYWVWGVDNESGTYKSRHLYPGDYAEARRVGQMLWDENVRSVKYRYHAESEDGLPGPGGPYEYDEHPLLFGQICPVQTLKACDCYVYQSCEHPGWPESEAHAYIQFLRGEATKHLRGYDDAEWEIREKGHATP